MTIRGQRRSTGGYGCLVFAGYMVIAGATWWVINGVFHLVGDVGIVMAILAVVAWKTAKKIRRVRRHAEALGEAVRYGHTVTAVASKPKGRTEAAGHAAGVKDARRIVAAGRGELPPNLTFQVEDAITEDWARGYQAGVREVISDAKMEDES